MVFTRLSAHCTTFVSAEPIVILLQVKSLFWASAKRIQPTIHRRTSSLLSFYNARHKTCELMVFRTHKLARYSIGRSSGKIARLRHVRGNNQKEGEKQQQHKHQENLGAPRCSSVFLYLQRKPEGFLLLVVQIHLPDLHQKKQPVFLIFKEDYLILQRS